MKKILLIGLALLTSAAFAATNKELEGFFTRSQERNPNITLNKFRVLSREAVKGANGWERADVNITFTPKGQTIPLSQGGSLYVYKGFVAPELMEVESDNKSKIVPDAKLGEIARMTLQSNPNVSLKASRVIKRVPVKEIEGLTAVAMTWDLDVKQGNETREISDTIVWFVGKNYILPDIYRIASGDTLKSEIKGDIKPEYYSADRLIAGNAKATNKVIVFSDPLCPACRNVMPNILKAASENPDKIALYYYAMPTHSVSPTLMKAALASKLNNKSVERAMYEGADFAQKASDLAKSGDDLEALKIFNAIYKTEYKLDDVNTEAILKHYNYDQKIASELLINSTPSFFINGKFDSNRQEIAKLLAK
ncbi:MAG: thioredoxin domain-containing protein [Helicobacteraceae bacterium]|jgi:protein-disulfide isomerase|nr:thioredoxin domain-containing protein [Helicobacteraceae bacterium]